MKFETLLRLCMTFFIGMVLGMILVSLQTDDSDKSFFKRSGMRIFTDYKTGKQYVGGAWGGVYPRMDKNGNHMSIEDGNN